MCPNLIGLNVFNKTVPKQRKISVCPEQFCVSTPRVTSSKKHTHSQCPQSCAVPMLWPPIPWFAYTAYISYEAYLNEPHPMTAHQISMSALALLAGSPHRPAPLSEPLFPYSTETAALFLPIFFPVICHSFCRSAAPGERVSPPTPTPFDLNACVRALLFSSGYRMDASSPSPSCLALSSAN